MGQKLTISQKKARVANNYKRRVAFLVKIATWRWNCFIHIFKQLLVPNLFIKIGGEKYVPTHDAYYIDYSDPHPLGLALS